MTTACDFARTMCASARASGPVIHCDEPSAAAMRPSTLIAVFSRQKLRPSRRCRRYGASERRAFSAPTPTSTVMPCSRSCAMPRPLTFGSGSSSATTTRATPAAISASVHGGVRPWCAHGSRVTYAVAPRARSPAASRASTSAWAPPGGWVAPSPTTSPSSTITHPTHGLGGVRSRARPARARACPISSRSVLIRAGPLPPPRRGSAGKQTARRGRRGSARPLQLIRRPLPSGL